MVKPNEVLLETLLADVQPRDWTYEPSRRTYDHESRHTASSVLGNATLSSPSIASIFMF